MTIPRKGSRRITVGGAGYRWRIRKKPTYGQGAFATPMRLAIQSADPGDKSILIVDLRISRPDNWIAPHQSAVTPEVVGTIIECARSAGWLPQSQQPFAFEYLLPAGAGDAGPQR